MQLGPPDPFRSRGPLGERAHRTGRRNAVVDRTVRTEDRRGIELPAAGHVALGAVNGCSGGTRAGMGAHSVCLAEGLGTPHAAPMVDPASIGGKSLGGWILPEGEEAWHLLSDNFEMPKHIDDKRDLLYISCPKFDHIIVSRISHQPRGRHRFCSGGAPSGPPRLLCSTPSPPDEDCFPPSRQQPPSYPTGPVLRRRPPPDPKGARFHSCCCLVSQSVPPPNAPSASYQLSRAVWKDQRGAEASIAPVFLEEG